MAIKDNFTLDRIFNFEPTSPGQVLNILQTLDVSKATGHDSIPVRALRYGAPALHYPLSSLFNVILQKGKLPSVWKEGEIAPVFKKGDQFDKTNFRPLTMLIAIDKVFEKCLHWQLSPFFGEILNGSLSAFRRHHSCSMVILRLREDWKRELDNDRTIDLHGPEQSI